MSGQRVNVNAAEKDVEKFIKFLVLKSTQVVVQSRLGEKIQTPCNPLATNSDWFNIVIQDHPDIYAETKRALALEPGQSILKRLPLCVEISLRTVEGDQMVLEVWSLDMQLPGCHKYCKDDICEVLIKNAENGKGGVANGTGAPLSEQQTLKAAHAIYNRMGILLKSLISLTRATPGYKLSRRQCPEIYGIYYRIYVDRPQLHTLGEGHKNVKIGQLNTIVGTLSMSVSYRTKMTITPTAADTHNGECNTIMLKSDHFRRADSSPTQNVSLNGLKRGNGTNGERKIVDIEKPLRPGAFTDVGKLRQWTEKDYVLPETPPFEWLLRRPRHESGGSAGSVESLNRKSDGSAIAPNTYNGQEQCVQNNNDGTGCSADNSTKAINNNNVMAFKSLENGPNGMQPKSPTDSATLSQSPIKSLLIPAPTTSRHSTTQTHQQSRRPDDDSLLKELNFPFALPNSHVNDLAKFYRDCYHAPPLLGLNETQPEAAVEQLEEFETSLEDYDELVSQLGLSTSSSTGSRSSGGLQMSN
ncbi:autophagy-related protein 13 homolog [Rhagoletis pomonella]|uniref:autophagy-related protein 13 homolog n=1 Tax=Rhagoletis pomonella TaxID=28610 RepID=UPI00177D8F3B|nr:autophagy-related protein 13 homolog [Rhagoletis pomonella]